MDGRHRVQHVSLEFPAFHRTKAARTEDAATKNLRSSSKTHSLLLSALTIRSLRLLPSKQSWLYYCRQHHARRKLFGKRNGSFFCLFPVENKYFEAHLFQVLATFNRFLTSAIPYPELVVMYYDYSRLSIVVRVARNDIYIQTYIYMRICNNTIMSYHRRVRME